MQIGELTAALIHSQAVNGRLDMENKFLMLRLRHQLKESESNAKKVGWTEYCSAYAIEWMRTICCVFVYQGV